MSYTCGTGAWSGPLPGDPSTNSILTATPVFGGIDITWTLANVNPHAVAHTYLYRSTNPDFLTAVRIAAVGGTHFYDKLENTLTYYYWIKIVSINGTVGEVIGPASAIPRLSIDATIEALTGRIDNGVLAKSLKEEIDRISLIDGDLFQEIQDRIAANELLGAAIQTVQTDASQAVSLLNEEITQRTTAYNVLLQSLNTMAGQVNDNKAAIQNEATLRISNDEALAQQITNVQSAAGDNLAAVQTTLQTNINTVNGKVTDIGALYTAKVQVNGLIGGFAVYNDGTEVQAGFDVDTFWVGRTGPDKKKPFIIDSATGETYINKAVIPTLTANMIDTKGLSIMDMDGNVILSAGTALDWSRIGGVGKSTVETNASTALANAATAQTIANAANATLADIAADNKLTAVEKQSAANEWGIINRERASIRTQADALGISYELWDYDYVYAVLNDYITPLLQDISSTSVIDGPTFRDKWSYFYEYRQRLLNKMAAVAATKADWSNVTGSGRPENGATVGANSSNLRAGPGVNMVFNGDYTDGLAGTTVGWRSGGNQHILSRNHPYYIVQGEGTASIHQPGWNGTAIFDANIWNGQEGQQFAVTPGQRYEVYAYLNTHRCVGRVLVLFQDAAGNQITDALGSEVNYTSIINTLSDMRLSHGFMVAPWNAAKALVIVRGYNIDSSDPYVFFSRVYFGMAHAGQTEASPWSPGRGISQITTSNVTTYIDYAAIGNAQIGGNLWSTNWNHAGGTGWLLDRSGNFYGNNVYARGDIQASSLKANTAMVNTLHINENAVTVPVTYTSTATTALAYNTWTTVGSAYINPEGAVVFVHAFAQFSNNDSNSAPMVMRVVSPSGAAIYAAGPAVASTVNWGTWTATRSGSVTLSGAFSEAGVYTLQMHPPNTNYSAHQRALLLLAGKR